jgi:hypothetical protein
MSLIFDVKKFMPGTKKFDSFGFCIFPLFDFLESDSIGQAIELYVNSGIFSVSLFMISDPWNSFRFSWAAVIRILSES